MFIKHKNMKDVCFQVVNFKTNSDLKIEATGYWWNIALGEPFAIISSNGLPARETIELKNPEEWEKYDDARSAKTGTESR